MITNLPLEIYELFINCQSNKIHKRKVYYFLMVGIKDFGARLSDKNKEIYYSILSLKQFQIEETLQINYNLNIENDIEIVKCNITHILGIFTQTRGKVNKLKIMKNLFEYLTLTKEGINFVNLNPKFKGTFIAKFIEMCDVENIFLELFFDVKRYSDGLGISQLCVNKKHSDVIIRFIEFDKNILNNVNETFAKKQKCYLEFTSNLLEEC